MCVGAYISVGGYEFVYVCMLVEMKVTHTAKNTLTCVFHMAKLFHGLVEWQRMLSVEAKRWKEKEKAGED